MKKSYPQELQQISYMSLIGMHSTMHPNYCHVAIMHMFVCVHVCVCACAFRRECVCVLVCVCMLVVA